MVWETQLDYLVGLGHHNSDPRGDPRPRGVPASFMFGYCSLSGMMGNLFAIE